MSHLRSENMNAIQTSSREFAVKAAAVGFERIGWEIEHCDIDLDAGRLDMVVRRFDGRWLRLHVDRFGRATMERFTRVIKIGVRAGETGPQSPQINDFFLGRNRCEGARSGLRMLCGYVAENPPPGFVALPAADVRRLLAPVLA